MRRSAKRWVVPVVVTPCVVLAGLAADPASAKQPSPTATTTKSNPGKGHPSPTPSPTPSATASPTAPAQAAPATATPAPPPTPPGVQTGTGGTTTTTSGTGTGTGTSPAGAPVAGVLRPSSGGAATGSARSTAGRSGSGATGPGSSSTGATSGPAAPHAKKAPRPEPTELLRLHHDDRAELGPLVQSLSQGATSNPQLPLGLFAVLGLFLMVQNRIDRRDPKLSATQAWSSVELDFRPVRRAPAAVRRRELPVRLHQVDRPVRAADPVPLEVVR